MCNRREQKITSFTSRPHCIFICPSVIKHQHFFFLFLFVLWELLFSDGKYSTMLVPTMKEHCVKSKWKQNAATCKTHKFIFFPSQWDIPYFNSIVKSSIICLFLYLLVLQHFIIIFFFTFYSFIFVAPVPTFFRCVAAIKLHIFPI